MLNTTKGAGRTDQMAVFVQVAELRSFTRTAERLGMTQPAVTFQISQLEDKWGCKLFLREHNAVQLTEAGEAFLAHASKLTKLCEDFTTTFRPLYADKEMPTYPFTDLRPIARRYAIQRHRKNLSDEFIAELIERGEGGDYYDNGVVKPSSN
jgi:DNA-binding MarR family transcriptional regulator